MIKFAPTPEELRQAVDELRAELDKQADSQGRLVRNLSARLDELQRTVEQTHRRQEAVIDLLLERGLVEESALRVAVQLKEPPPDPVADIGAGYRESAREGMAKGRKQQSLCVRCGSRQPLESMAYSGEGLICLLCERR
ncbi:MAG: hypothetical protein KC416_09805 [Myxococcales bacterium]|nr:hypothetical protein [Myxococcales bacterium]